MEFIQREQALTKPKYLIMPALSIGNVGQLVVDLLISSSVAHKVGYLDSECILPCIGNDPYNEFSRGELAVALEVYEEPANDLRIVQQRAPVIKGTMLNFAKDFSAWVKNSSTDEVIILSGVDSGKRPMQDIGRSPIRYISTANLDGTDQRCEALGWKKLEDYEPSNNSWKLLESQCLENANGGLINSAMQINDEMYYPNLPFSSLFSCCKVRGLRAVCILLFCSEGDNIQDAVLLGDSLQSFLSLDKGMGADCGSKSWTIPYSWRSVYGPPPEPTIFY
ncbi:hypothetical protein KP509_11G058700 [Ceratopteris richardii]|uniref:Proteasome assembly chaperone 2 n=1 Tax=Ceratopteris richardii TaxID=49495 RepID=A0A8T2TPS2_CERRI|nr:hypothetical protein KP509_11G058700 [Ceratopteris richardii]KAH7425519.1 hypothetical protein KP509_11G058700 [Ceratopteris richardii]KAH7425520.1 hypothetical protein KP509_11G058700 [Ceratopteris richardii]KAH7425521.1 hypothetical protein KP509_11G058700 [Ceratopteris richardii]